MNGARNFATPGHDSGVGNACAVPDGGGGPRIVGRYLLWGSIGSGGCATVHLGRLLSEGGFSRTVAIKRLHSECASNPEFVEMFLDEARLVARIHHRNVVPSLDVFWSAPEAHETRELLMIMEYVAGATLSRLLAKSRKLGETPPQPIALAIICDVLRGLHAAHEARSEDGTPLELVHRDVSPQNAIVGSDGVARLLDFGIAKAVGRLHTTRQGVFKGKTAYMAPEQVLGAADKLSDVYAASVMLWEALTARRLFSGENASAVLHAVLNQPVAPPSSLVSGVSPALEAVVMSGLSRNPAERPYSAEAMAQALEAAAELASPSEVSAWVRRLAHDELEARQAQVTRLEQFDAAAFARGAGATSSSGLVAARETRATPSPADELETTIRPTLRTDPVTVTLGPLRRDRAWLAMFALLGALLLLLLALAITRRSAPQPMAALPAASSALPSSVGSNLPPPAVVLTAPAAAAALPSATATEVLGAPATSERRAQPRPAPAVKVAPRRNCSPPYVVDSAGRTHFKTECL